MVSLVVALLLTPSLARAQDFDGSGRVPPGDVPPAVEVPVATAAPVALDAATREAARLALIRGLSSDQTLAPDAAAVEEIKTALAAARALDPEMAQYAIDPSMTLDDSVALGYKDTLRPTLAALILKNAANKGPDNKIRLAALGVKELDDVAAATGGVFVLSESFGDIDLEIHFDRIVDLQKVVKKFAGAPQLGWAEVNGTVYTGGGLTEGFPVLVDQDGAGWRITFHHGWGDCMAGCLNNEYWFYSVDKGVATKSGYYRNALDGAQNAYVEMGAIPWTPASPW